MTAPDGDDAVLCSRVGAHVALVTLNRAAARNAVSPAVAAGLARAVATTEADPEIWAVVLTGSGDQAFCAGADLKAIAAGQAAGLWVEPGGFAGFVHASRTKVWIAAVNGAALAGGLEIMLACDMAVAAEHAVFGLPEVRRGLIAAAGGVTRLPRAIPRAIALEMIATGTPIDAARAHGLGLVNRMVPAGEVVPAAIALAETICGNAPLAVRESLALARGAADRPERDQVQATAEARARIAATEDYREGPRAFAEKRPPRWSGR